MGEKINLKEASRDELFRFATEVLGLDVAKNASQTDIIGKIFLADPDLEHIERPAQPEVLQQASDVLPPAQGSSYDTRPQDQVQAAGKRAARLDTDSRNDRRVCIILQRQDLKNGTKEGERPKFVGVNGVGVLIPRGEPVIVAERYVNALRIATETVYEQDDQTGDVIEFDVPNTPFQVLDPAPQGAKVLNEQRVNVNMTAA